MALNFYRLRVFCAIVDEQSISRTAARLRVTQPVLSRLVTELERHYGGALLIRRGHRVFPTEIGVIVYRYAKELLQATEITERLVSECLSGERGVVSVGITTAIGGYTFPFVWQRFHEAHPHAEVVLRLLDSEFLIQNARDGLLDIGLVMDVAFRDTTYPEVLSEPLGRVDTVLVAAAGDPLANRRVQPGELAGRTILSTNGAANYKDLARTLDAWGIADQCKIVRFGDTETVKRGVEAGLGLARFARMTVTRELTAGTLAGITVDGTLAQYQLLLVRHQTTRSSPLINAFAEHLHGQAGVLLGHA